MRTTPFRKVFDKVVRLHGRNPRKEISADLANAVVDHINDRLRTIWTAWRWPEWERTEERAFRTVWNDTRQFLRVGVDGNPDELYYLTNATYYRVMADAPSDPPVGTSPTNGTFFEALTPLDTFIEYDQECKRSIGMMLGVYRQNPRNPTCSRRGGLRYMPSERGIDVCRPGVKTVWIIYKLPLPVFTIQPHVVGRTYAAATVVFDTGTGECFQALEDTSAVLADTSAWRWVPFLTTWEDYVTKGAFADSLMEFDQGGNGDLQAKMVLNQYWDGQATDALQTEVDMLVTQGQSLKWTFGGRFGDWCESLPWCGGEVVPLTATTPFASLVTDEVPSGLIDGSNQVFTTLRPFSTLWVFLNGQKMIRDTDYTITSTTTFTMTVAPTLGDSLVVDYIRP